MLTTHYMDEAEQLCDRLVIMDGGRIVAEGSPAELIATHATREVVELRFPRRPTSTTSTLAMLDGSPPASSRLADRVLVYTDDGDARARRGSARRRARAGGDAGPPRQRSRTCSSILTGRTLED